MIFSPDLAELVVAGKKTVTRRPRTGSNPTGEPGGWVDDPCRYKAGKTYAVQPGRGKKAIGRILVKSVRPELMTDLDDDEARLEGFKNTREFVAKWLAIYGKGSWLDIVWRIEFELARGDVIVSDTRLPLGELDPASVAGKRAQAQAWLDSHLPHSMTEDECVPCQMATNVLLLCEWVERLREALYLYADPRFYTHGPDSQAAVRYDDGRWRPRTHAELDGGVSARLRLSMTGGCTFPIYPSEGES